MTKLPSIEEFQTLAPDLLFQSDELDAFLDKLRKETDTSEVSVGSEEGRAKIKSNAHKVARYKTALDEARKKSTEDLRKKTKEINDRGNEAITKLATLQADIRRPLDQWEEQDRARVAEIQAKLTRIEALGRVIADDTSATVAERLKELHATLIDKTTFAEQFNTALAAREVAIHTLEMALTRLQKAEAEAAELAELRRMKLELEAQQAEQRRKAEAEEAERIRAEQEAARKAAEERRIAEARAAAEAAAKAEAERKAREEAERIQREADERVRAAQREADEKIAAERRAREEAERKAREEREAAERKAAAEREAEEKRIADAKHRLKVRNAAVNDLANTDLSGGDVWGALFDDIAAGKIRHLKVEW